MGIEILVRLAGNPANHAFSHVTTDVGQPPILLSETIAALEEALATARGIQESLEEQERRIEAGEVRTLDDGFPSPVHTQEGNDCGICATQYACRWFCIPEDRAEIKRLCRWDPAIGGGPAFEYLHRFNIETPGWYCKGLDKIPDPDRPGVTLQPPTPANQDRLFAAYQEQLATGAIGLATIMLPAGPHAVVIIHAEPETGCLWVVCSLRGLYHPHKSEFFTGPTGKLNGGVVWWVRRKEAQR